MDNVKIQELSNVIVNNWRKRDSDVQDKLNRIFNGRKPKRVLCDLNKSIRLSTLKDKDKNKATLIIVLALLRRNLDCTEEINFYLKQYGMINLLYGGLIQFLNGKSDSFKIESEWDIEDTDNNYEFIFRSPGPKHWTFKELISAASILQENNLDKFENLLLKDKTNLLLLNYTNSFCRFEPTERLIVTLLKDENSALRRSIGLFVILSPIKRISDNENNSTREHRTIVSKEIEFVHKILSDLKPSIQAELLVNYFLYNKRSKYYIFLAKLMVNPLLKEDLIKEIYSKKVRNLEDIFILLFVIRNTRVRNSNNIKFKSSLYKVITDKIQSFIEKGIGIYFWDVQTENQFKNICSLLPKKDKVNIKRFIQKENSKLMVSRLDELIRPGIFLEDTRKSEILNGMDKVITTELSKY
ncbi:hypothetical protein [Bacillus cereus]